MKKTQKSEQPSKSRNGKQTAPPRPAPKAQPVPRALSVAKVVAETKSAMSAAAKRSSHAKVHDHISKVASHAVGPVDISAEERAVCTAFSTLHPELMRGKVADSITSATSELRTVTNFAFDSMDDGTGKNERVLFISPFLNDQITIANTYAGGVVATTAVADNPAYAAWVSNIGEFRLVSMSVVVSNITAALSMQGIWTIGNARFNMIPLVGYNYNTYAQVVDFAKGEFSPNQTQARMVWMANDESDRNFWPLASTVSSLGQNSTCVYVAVSTGVVNNSFRLQVTCNWEAIPVPSAQTYIATTATPTDPGTFTQAMAAGADSAIKHVDAVTNPVDADKASGNTLATLASAALGVAGDVLSGDMPGIAKSAAKLLSPVTDAVEDAVGFVADGISSLFGLSLGADHIFRMSMAMGAYGDQETKLILDEITKLDKKLSLGGKLSTPVAQIASLRLELVADKYPRRIREIVGVNACLNGQQTLLTLPEGEQYRTKRLLRNTAVKL